MLFLYFSQDPSLFLWPVTIASEFPSLQLERLEGGVQEAVLTGKADFGITSVRPKRGLRSVHLRADKYVVMLTLAF